MRSTRLILLFAGLIGVASSLVSAPPEANAAEPPGPATLRITGTSDIPLPQYTPWVDAFSDTETTLRYVSSSSARARAQMAAGEIDAAIIGTPFTQAEKSGSKVGATIDVPLQVSAAMFLLSEPFPQGFEQLERVDPADDPACDPNDADYDPANCERRAKFTGPIRVPHENLAAMLLGVSGPDGLNRWRNPAVLEALEAPDLNIPPLDAPTVIHREPGESVNFHLQRFVTTAAPEVWELAKLANPGVPYAVDESVPRVLTRSTPSFQSQQVGIWQTDPRSGGATSSGWAGNMADIPPAVRLEAKETFPSTPFRVVQMRNKAGDWVEPTPDSISKAVSAGGDKPLYALSTPVVGAYPLVWVNKMAVPAKGLTPEKANAAAAFIRYVATVGQTGARALGEGRLSGALAAEALKGADAIVKGNCTGSDVRVTTISSPGPYAPAALAQAKLTATAHCERLEPASPAPEPESSSSTPLPTTPPILTEVPSVSGDGGGDFATVNDGGEVSVAPDEAVELTAGPREPQAVATRRVRLPFGKLISGTPGVDRLATMLLGAGLFLVIRATLWPRVRRRYQT